MRRPRGQQGFSLVELMLGLLLVSIVGLTLASATLVGYRAISTETRQISADEAVAGASQGLIRDLSSATAIPTGTISAGAGTFTLTYGSPLVTVTYAIDGQKNLTRTVGASTTVLARGMQSVTIAAAGVPACYRTATLTPSAIGASAVTLNVTQRVGAGGCF